jgi:queuine tRNA-ribosyltransferase
MKNGEFKLLANDGGARAGILQTAHGAIETPVFMPVGTKASVKSLDPNVVSSAGSRIILANTYHLYLSPGADLISKMGGLHNFMHWDKPILTDSGGFQVFSLGAGKKDRNLKSDPLRQGYEGQEIRNQKFQARSLKNGHPEFSSGSHEILKPSNAHNYGRAQQVQDDKLNEVIPEAKITEEGVEFRSHRDGSKHTITPEKSIEIQAKLGADIIMAFDECPPYPSTREYYKESMERTHRWLLRCIAQKKSLEKVSNLSGLRNLSYSQNAPKDQLLFGIIQGGMFNDLRQESAKFVVAQNLPGIAIGGVANGGESRELMMNQIEWITPHLPNEKPRYLMGIGTPIDLIEFISRGIDMFDCVLPTRLGRNGAFWTVEAAGEGKNCTPPRCVPSVALAKDGPRMYTFEVYKEKGIRAQIKNAQFTEDMGPLMQGCDCTTCTRFSRAYIHHLFIEDEPLGMQFLSIHNIHLLISITKILRESILNKNFTAVSQKLRQIWE